MSVGVGIGDWWWHCDYCDHFDHFGGNLNHFDPNSHHNDHSPSVLDVDRMEPSVIDELST